MSDEISVEETVEYLTNLQVQSMNQEEIDELYARFDPLKSQPENYSFALRLLQSSSDQKVVVIANHILQHIIVLYWIPHTLAANSTPSLLTDEIKAEIRTVLFEIMSGAIQTYEEASSNLILGLIATIMKIDFENEGQFWLEQFFNAIQDHQTCFQYVRLIRYLAEQIQTPDRSLSNQAFLEKKAMFGSIVPQLMQSLVDIMADSSTPLPVFYEIFEIIKSICLSPNPEFHKQIPDLIQILLQFSASSTINEVSIEALKTLHVIFSRVNFVEIFDVEERQQILATSFEFFEEEMSQFDPSSSTYDYLNRLVNDFQPLA